MRFLIAIALAMFGFSPAFAGETYTFIVENKTGGSTVQTFTVVNNCKGKAGKVALPPFAPGTTTRVTIVQGAALPASQAKAPGSNMVVPSPVPITTIVPATGLNGGIMTLSSGSGCANGQCPTSRTGLFGRKK